MLFVKLIILKLYKVFINHEKERDDDYGLINLTTLSISIETSQLQM